MPVPFPEQSVLGWKIALTLLDCIAVIATFFRLWLRHRQSKLWWDDAMALVPTGALVVLLTVMYQTRTFENAKHIFTDPATAAASRFQNHWNSSFLLLTCVWGSRISLSLGLLRIFPSWSRSRTVAICLSGSFAVIYLFLVIIYPASCKNSAGGTKMDFFSSCIIVPSGSPLPIIMSVVLNYIGDFLLVACPLYMLWGLRLPTGEHRLILILFSSSFATFLVVIALTILHNGPFIQSENTLIASYGVAHLESTVALMVCNLMVIAGYSYRVYRSSKSRTLVYISGSGETRRIGTGHGTFGGQSTHGVTKSIAVEVSTDGRTEKGHIDIPLDHLKGPETNSMHDDIDEPHTMSTKGGGA